MAREPQNLTTPSTPPLSPAARALIMALARRAARADDAADQKPADAAEPKAA